MLSGQGRSSDVPRLPLPGGGTDVHMDIPSEQEAPGTVRQREPVPSVVTWGTVGKRWRLESSVGLGEEERKALVTGLQLCAGQQQGFWEGRGEAPREGWSGAQGSEKVCV